MATKYPPEGTTDEAVSAVLGPDHDRATLVLPGGATMQVRQADYHPEFWPPRVGDIARMRGGSVVCITRPGHPR